MKKINLYIVALILGSIFFGCDKPAPTELVQDFSGEEDPVSVQVITKNIDDDVTGSGYDSTGITDNLYKFTNVIAVNGIKVTAKNITFNKSLALAVFFDKSSPVILGGKLIGYKTRILGTVEFDGYKAHLLPYKKSFRRDGASFDTTLGFFHFLYSGRSSKQDSFQFNYGSNINFLLDPIFGKSVTFNIPTPPEITGSLNIERRAADKNLNIILEWNRLPGHELQIVIGASPKGTDKMLPIYKLRTRDDGKLRIPPNLLKALSVDKFDKFSFTLIRRFNSFHHGRNDLYILSQSIHTIIIGNH